VYIRVHPWLSCQNPHKQGFLERVDATVSETVSKAESQGTIRHHWSKLADTLPLLAFTHAVEAGQITRFEQNGYEI